MCSEPLLGSGVRLDRPGTEFNYAPSCIIQLRAAFTRRLAFPRPLISVPQRECQCRFDKARSAPRKQYTGTHQRHQTHFDGDHMSSAPIYLSMLYPSATILPGFMMFCGSSAVLTARIASSAASPCSALRYFILPWLTPCSPEQVPSM